MFVVMNSNMNLKGLEPHMDTHMDMENLSA
jgi:hypothetical protein